MELKRNGFAAVAAAWRNDTWARPFFARYWRVLALALALGVVAAAFGAALMFTSGYMISLAATLPFTVLAVHVPSLYVRIFGVGKPALSYLERLASHDWALRMTSELRRRLYRAIDAQSAASRCARKAGEVLGLLAEDIEHIQNLYLRTVFPLVVAWLLYVAVVALVGAFSGAVAAAMALLLGVVVLVLPLASVCANGARLERAKALKAQLYDNLTDNVLGVADWVYSGRSEDYLHRFAALQREAAEIDAAVARFGRLRDLFAQLLFGLAVVVLVAWAAVAFAPASPAAEGAAGALASFVPENAIAHAGNWIAAFALCLFPLIESFAPASEAAMGLITYGDSIERLNALSGQADEGTGRPMRDERDGWAERDGRAERSEPDAPSSTSERVEPSVLSSAPERSESPASSERPTSDAPSAPSEPVRFPKAVDVVFENVAFSYGEGEKRVLSGMSLHIPAGQKLAVLGKSGAGKSTLVSLLRGDYAPLEGSVRVGGLECSQVGEALASVVGIIRQKPHLFNWTLRDNVALGKPSATDDEVEASLRQVGLGQLLERLPQGLSTMVDERGQRFSGGERHRIALARVLLANPAVVVLDEPFAGLDLATEQALVEVMLQVLGERTVVLVTHHLQGVSQFDRVVFVEDGGIVMDGSPAQLASQNERYQRLLAFDRGVSVG